MHGDPGAVTAAAKSPRTARRLAGAAGIVAAVAAVALPVGVVSAHTETDVVAVPAGATATVTFEPEHGCGDSPTTDMQVQAPVANANAIDKQGWTAKATPDGEGNTVLEWSGGSQPAHEQGAFEVQFTVPDAVGTLLAFPAVQRCANGQQLAWIDTEAGAESPAPQLLVLAAGSQPAASLDDVPADAPGRDQLVAAAGEPDEDEETAAPATSATSVSAPEASAVATAVAASDSGGGLSGGWIAVIVIAAIVVVGAVAAVVVRSRRRPGSAGVGAGDGGEQVGPGPGDA
jgi:periplasmic copper chaperone A